MSVEAVQLAELGQWHAVTYETDRTLRVRHGIKADLFDNAAVA